MVIIIEMKHNFNVSVILSIKLGKARKLFPATQNV